MFGPGMMSGPTEPSNAVAGTVSDAVDGDVASVTGATINAGDQNEAGNGPLDIAANRVWAILFRTLMQ